MKDPDLSSSHVPVFFLYKYIYIIREVDVEVEVRWHRSEKVKQHWRLSDRQHSLQLHALPAFPPFFPSFPPLPACLSVCVLDCREKEIRSHLAPERGCEAIKRS